MTSAQTLITLTIIATVIFTAFVTWLIVYGRTKAKTGVLSAQLEERTKQIQFFQNEKVLAEDAMRDAQDRFQNTYVALTQAQAELKQMEPLQNELAEARSRIDTLRETAQKDVARLTEAVQKIKHLQGKEEELGRLKEEHEALRQQLSDSHIRNERLATQIEQERHNTDEKLSLLTEARQSLSDQFQNLANNILEEKSKRFTEHNTESITRLLTPLNERMGKFSELVQNTYEKESKERLTLENELKRLQTLNHQLHSDAKALTEALTGTQNKTQGNWGEMILESVLENSGLVKGREYFVQTAASREDENGGKRRLQPDVLVNLPDNKQIVIDSKVSLTAYVRYTQAQNDADAARELGAHVASVRSHIKSLSEKKYTELDGVNTLDFVFMFIPVEPAYLLALQHDGNLFQECFDKRIMLVGPSTLLATLRTVANIWRNEQQNQNALAIAEEGGRLYDKFVGFVATLESVGKNIEQAQNQYQAAFKQLSEGRGNLIKRAEKLRELGVKAGKQLDKNLTGQAQEDSPALEDKEGCPEKEA